MSLSAASWPLVGEARLRVLLWEVYDSALYTPSGRWLGAGPYQLSLTYLRDIPVEQLIKETRKAWDGQSRVHSQQESWLQVHVQMLVTETISRQVWLPMHVRVLVME